MYSLNLRYNTFNSRETENDFISGQMMQGVYSTRDLQDLPSWGKQQHIGGGDDSEPNDSSGSHSYGKQDRGKGCSTVGKPIIGGSGNNDYVDEQGFTHPGKRKLARSRVSAEVDNSRVDVYLDLETVEFVDEESQMCLLDNIQSIISRKIIKKGTVCGNVNAYAVHPDSPEEANKFKYLRDNNNNVNIIYFHKREMTCRHCKDGERAVKTELAQMEMLCRICLNAIKVQRNPYVKALMIISGDPFFTDDLAQELEKEENGALTIITELPKGVREINMYDA